MFGWGRIRVGELHIKHLLAVARDFRTSHNDMLRAFSVAGLVVGVTPPGMLDVQFVHVIGVVEDHHDSTDGPDE